MGKSTISMVMFNSELSNYQRVVTNMFNVFNDVEWVNQLNKLLKIAIYGWIH
jgi:hypothetical protein